MITNKGPISFPNTADIAPYLRVKLAGGVLAVANATDPELGTLNTRALAGMTSGSVVPRWEPGARYMVASAAIAQFGDCYGADGGFVSSTVNSNYWGMALDAASGAGSIIRVLVFVKAGVLEGFGDIGGKLLLDDDFVADYPAAATAINKGWTKVETNGLGVISSVEPNGVLKFSFGAVNEAATAALYLKGLPFDIDQSPICEFIVAVADKGTAANLSINFGLASGTHATTFTSIANYIGFNVAGNTLLVNALSTDGTTTVAPVSTTLSVVLGQYAKFKIDLTDKANPTLYAAMSLAAAYQRVLVATSFSMAAYAGALTPIVHVAKTANATTADVRLDRIRAVCGRN